MPTELDETAWLSEHYRVSIVELSALCGLPDDLLRELVECGALSPMNQDDGQWTFSARCVVTLRRAGRLRHDFELDSNALAVALPLLERINELEEQLHALHAQIPRRIR